MTDEKQRKREKKAEKKTKNQQESYTTCARKKSKILFIFCGYTAHQSRQTEENPILQG